MNYYVSLIYYTTFYTTNKTNLGTIALAGRPCYYFNNITFCGSTSSPLFIRIKYTPLGWSALLLVFPWIAL